MLAAACDKESALLHKQQSLLAKSLQAAQEELNQLKGACRANMLISPTQSEEVGHYSHMCDPFDCVSDFASQSIPKGAGFVQKQPALHKIEVQHAGCMRTGEDGIRGLVCSPSCDPERHGQYIKRMRWHSARLPKIGWKCA